MEADRRELLAAGTGNSEDGAARQLLSSYWLPKDARELLKELLGKEYENEFKVSSSRLYALLSLNVRLNISLRPRVE